MGTSKSYGGPGSGLVPSWIDDGGAPSAPTPTSPAGPALPGTPPQPGTPPGQAPAQPPAQSAPPSTGQPDRQGTSGLAGAKGRFSTFARTGSSGSLGGALRRHVSSSGGAAKASRRMGASKAVGGRLLGLVRDAQSVGLSAALRARGLEHLIGGTAEAVFLGLTDIVCPPGGPIDEAIARQAMLEAIGDQADAGVADFGALTPEQLKEFFLDFVIRSIEGRVMSDIAARLVTIPQDVGRVLDIQQQLHDFIAGCARSQLSDRLGPATALDSGQLDLKVNAIYEAAFGLVAAAGEAAE
jgi:hypothetical protein